MTAAKAASCEQGHDGARRQPKAGKSRLPLAAPGRLRRFVPAGPAQPAQARGRLKWLPPRAPRGLLARSSFSSEAARVATVPMTAVRTQPLE